MRNPLSGAVIRFLPTVFILACCLTAAPGSAAAQAASAESPMEETLRLCFSVPLNGSRQASREPTAALLRNAAKIAEPGGKDLLEGWVRRKGKTYYYRKGKPVSGWQEIDGFWYYFKKDTKVLQKNQIAGNRKQGYYYVDSDGIRVTDSVVCLAVKCVRQNTTTDMTRKEKLKACFDYFVNDCQYLASQDKENISKMPGYAQDMFTRRKGNCYRGAAALTYCAKVLGFQVRMGIGSVASRRTGPMYRHGWCEVKCGKNYYICDISMARRHTEKLYLVRRKDYPFRLKKAKNYELLVSAGEPVWEDLS